MKISLWWITSLVLRVRTRKDPRYVMPLNSPFREFRNCLKGYVIKEGIKYYPDGSFSCLENLK